MDLCRDETPLASDVLGRDEFDLSAQHSHCGGLRAVTQDKIAKQSQWKSLLYMIVLQDWIALFYATFAATVSRRGVWLPV